MINRKKSFIIFVIMFFVLESCDESFSPYGTFNNKYSLNCIVRADTNYQVSTIFQSYSLNDNSSSQNRSDYFVHNASIRLWSGNDDVYILNEKTDTLNNTTPIDYYYTKDFIPEHNANLEIDVLLDNGIRLKSKTKVPDFVEQDMEKVTKSIPPKAGNVVTFAWKIKEDGLMYVPTLQLIYRQKVGETLIQKRVEIPWKYLKEDGKEIGINKPPSKIPLVKYSLSNIEKVLRSISEGDSEKDNYFILTTILTVKIFDKNLSAYYLTSGRIFDNYSIRLDTQDFSNIEGGFGIFGSFIEQKMVIVFDEEYLTRFGYRSAF